MNNCFVFETLTDVKNLKKDVKNGLMTLSGVFGECGVRNNNNRVYEKSNYGKMVSEMQGRIKDTGAIPGELEHPATMNITLENISHKITDINIDENGLVTGTIQLLNTPKGKIAQAIVEGGLPLFVSSRAQGVVDSKSGAVTLEKLATFDLVGTPGFSQARMHLNESQICESLSDNIFVIKDSQDVPTANINENNEINEDMELKEIQEKLDALNDKVSLLEAENQRLRESQTANIKKLAEAVQMWTIDEFAPVVEKWVAEEYNSHAEKNYREMLVKEAAPLIQKWVVEEFAPEVEKWIVEEYSPMVEKWVTEQYSPEVEKWVVEKVAPAVQDWIVEQYSPTLQDWMNEHYVDTVKNVVKEGLANNKDSKLKSITETLELLEGLETKKPAYQGRVITENVEEPLYIQNMPEDLRPKYNMASQEVKESIARRARIYDFSKEGSLERFWGRINFDQPATVTESKVDLETIQDRQERAIRAAFRRNRGIL